MKRQRDTPQVEKSMGEFCGLFCIWVSGQLEKPQGAFSTTSAQDRETSAGVRIPHPHSLFTSTICVVLWAFFNHHKTWTHRSFTGVSASVTKFHIQKGKAALAETLFAFSWFICKRQYQIPGELTVNKWDYGGADAQSYFHLPFIPSGCSQRLWWLELTLSRKSSICLICDIICAALETTRAVSD